MSCGKLNFKNKDVLVIGGGAFAYRKVFEFLEDGANVTCLYNEFIPELQALDVVKIKKDYHKDHIVDSFIVCAATQSSVLNHQIVMDANTKGIISASVHNDIDAIYTPMKFEEYDDLTIALSTSGKFPAFCKTVFDDIRNLYEQRYHSRLEYLGIIRDYMIEYGIERKYLLEDLLSASIEELRFYCDSIRLHKATVYVFHGVKKNEMYTEILKFIKKVDLDDRGEYFAYLDEDALKEYNYFEELNRIISLEKMSKTLDLLRIEDVTYQPMLFEKGSFYEQMQTILHNRKIAPLLFDKQMLEAVLLNYLPKGQNLIVLPELKSDEILKQIENLRIPKLYVMKLNDELPEADKSVPLHVTGFFVLMGEELTRKVFGKDGVYVHMIETDYDAEMNRKILIQDETFIQCAKQRMKMY